ncbi:hypothetical protein EYS14_10245 [Alteromonadaceae bacterium M269]|nr:hypothetical protein EYS14_10245 [Alteromonadaceae bacterium M269]
MNRFSAEEIEVEGSFVTIDGETFYAINHVDQMPPFFVSLVSNSDHWLFISSTGGLTAGRVSPETALFPYTPVDKIHESSLHTGSKTLIRLSSSNGFRLWEPFNEEQSCFYHCSRHLYKNELGNKIRFEEVNEDLGLVFSYTWSFSDDFGFVRECQLTNLNEEHVSLEIIDGLQNILPAGTPRYTQTQSSNLVDAYKWSEIDSETGLAFFTLYSGITDRAEPSESLRANTVFCLGLKADTNLLSSEQLNLFKKSRDLTQESLKKGVRGAYLVHSVLELMGKSQSKWVMVANLEQDQSQVAMLNKKLRDPDALANAISRSVDEGNDELARIVATSDGFQQTNESLVSLHHYANTLFNVLRGGTFSDQYKILTKDFVDTLALFNRPVFNRHQHVLQDLPEALGLDELHGLVTQQNDEQLKRLATEYLPITFGRRHGDPSRPWNQFELRFKDEQGNPLLSYQGNWRDIFQNWEALLFSYPDYIEQVIAKFVNASTVDGYNPYRITKQGIDWEVEEPDDPWSYIGYWGDHQVIYLLKLLELSDKFHPGQLHYLLDAEIFSFANVPYRIKAFDELLKDPKNTVLFDEELACKIDERVSQIGSDGKLLLDESDQVYQVNLLEKLLITLLSKLSNFVLGGGIWLNTQRPEWNDANNALVGQGLSMVTLYYMRRYIDFLSRLLSSTSVEQVQLSNEVARWLTQTALAISELELSSSSVKWKTAHQLMLSLGQIASEYRTAVYCQEGFSGKTKVKMSLIQQLLDDSQRLIDESISVNRADDGLYHAYNLLEADNESLRISHLYPMLEGQVAALSSGALKPEESNDVLDKLFDSAIFRADQKTFMLYPDRDLPSFLEKNKLPATVVESNPLLATMLKLKDERVVRVGVDGEYRFNADLKNSAALLERISSLSAEYGDVANSTIEHIAKAYEEVFSHKAFTGRSGGMFGFEGLGCIYWHMVAKLLLAVQEQFFAALEKGASAELVRKLGAHYYAVREGIGFNKTPQEYGAFPCDPYSHTPKHAGAQQPGMTGQVKEEVLTRFGELGIKVSDGRVSFEPYLLRKQEFNTESSVFRYLDICGDWQNTDIPEGSLAFTWCQVPIVYRLSKGEVMVVTIEFSEGKKVQIASGCLSQEESRQIFGRKGVINRIDVEIPEGILFE